MSEINKIIVTVQKLSTCLYPINCGKLYELVLTYDITAILVSQPALSVEITLDICFPTLVLAWVTHDVGPNLPLTPKQRLLFSTWASN